MIIKKGVYLSKGTTPVIEVMIITIIILSVSVMFIFWGMNTKETFSEATERESQEQIDKISTAFTIAYMEGDILGIKNKEKNTIYSSDLTFFLDGSKFVPLSSPYSIDFANTGEFRFSTELKDYEIQVSGAHGKTDAFLPETSFIKTKKYAVPEEFPSTQKTRVYIELSGEYGLKKNRDYPVDLVMLVDVSGSMSYGCLKNISNPGPPTCVSDCNQCPIDCNNPSEDGTDCRICVAKNAVSLFLDKLDSDNDQSGLVSFCDKAYLKKGLTKDHQSVKSEVSSLIVGGGTNISGSIRIANQQSWRTGALRAEILLTDGKPVGGDTPSACEAAAQQAASKGIKIYTIGFIGGDPSYFNETLLKKIANITNAKYYFAANSDILNEIYDRILSEELLGIAGKGVKLVDVIPDNVRYQGSLTQSVPSDVCNFYNNPFPRKDNLTCTLGDIKIGDRHVISFQVNFTTLGCNQPTNAYPDSLILYKDYTDVEHVKVLPNITVNVTGGPVTC